MAMDSVTIPEGQNILYDLPESPEFFLILVEGKLVFDDTQDVSLDAHYIMVRYVEAIHGRRCYIIYRRVPFLTQLILNHYP